MKILTKTLADADIIKQLPEIIMEEYLADESCMNQEYFDLMEGRTIIKVRLLTLEEQDLFRWKNSRNSSTAIVIILDDGTTLIPSRDDEARGPGTLLVTNLSMN